MKNNIQVSINKKMISLTVERMVMYKQTKVIELKNKNGYYYYGVFYKDQFINIAKAKKIKLHSYMHQALKNGITFDRNHPLTTQLLPNTNKFFSIKFNQLFQNLQKTYPLADITFIFQFFDSFTKKGSSQKILKNTFYELRRNGKNLKAYQLLKMYLNYTPTDRFAKDMIQHIDFQRQEMTYANIEAILEKDPDYVEAVCFDDRLQTTALELLYQIYRKQQRTLDELAVRLDVIIHHYSTVQLKEIEKLLSTRSVEDQVYILHSLSKKIENNEIDQLLFKKLLDLNDSNQLVQFIMEKQYQPTNEQISLITHHFNQADKDVLSSYFRIANKRLLQLSNEEGKMLEKMVSPFVFSFMENYNLMDILDWFEVFHQANITLPIEKKLKRMQMYKEDPDQQLALGELYLDFKQFEKSIDCFKWEMEINPDNTKAVSYLTKVYRKLGNVEEANVYQQLLKKMG